jgi:hypothetical protein
MSLNGYSAAIPPYRTPGHESISDCRRLRLGAVENETIECVDCWHPRYFLTRPGIENDDECRGCEFLQEPMLWLPTLLRPLGHRPLRSRCAQSGVFCGPRRRQPPGVDQRESLSIESPAGTFRTVRHEQPFRVRCIEHALRVAESEQALGPASGAEVNHFYGPHRSQGLVCPRRPAHNADHGQQSRLLPHRSGPFFRFVSGSRRSVARFGVDWLEGES